MKTGSFFQKYCFFTLYYMTFSSITVFFQKNKKSMSFSKMFYYLCNIN